MNGRRLRAHSRDFSIDKVERFLFACLFFFLPFQTGKHFWPRFSFVSGIRIDYLSPTLYFLDVIVFLLFLVNFFKKRNIFFKTSLLFVAFILFISSFLAGLFFAREQSAAIFGLIKFLEFIFLGLYVAYSFKEKYIDLIVKALAFGALFSSVMAIWQFAAQRSIGGIFYFLGERNFFLSTPGIAAMDIGGKLILRPYAAFPHPNLLAFFLLFSGVFILNRIAFEKTKTVKLFFIFVLLISGAALLLTFSRTIIALYLFFTIYFLFKIKISKSMKLLFSAGILLTILVYFWLFYYRFFNLEFLTRDFLLRNELAQIALKIISKSPIFGVSLNNPFYYEVFYQKNLSPTFLQPVHNIFLLILSQAGALGLAAFLILIYVSLLSVYKNIKNSQIKKIKSFYIGVLFIFIAFLIAGLFDHFPLTLEQGEIMLAIILGFSFSRLSGS